MTQKTLTNQYETNLHAEIIKLCHGLELSLHDNVLGSKIYTNYQRVALIILQMRSGKSLRKFVDELVESKWPRWLGLKELVTKSTLQRWIKKFTMFDLRRFLDQTISVSKPEIMAIDATGFDSWQRSRHYENRLKQFGVNDYKMPFTKVDLLVDTSTKLIYDFVVRVKPRHDVLGAKTMINRLKHKGVLILADKGYDSEELHKLAFKKGNLLYAPVRGVGYESGGESTALKYAYIPAQGEDGSCAANLAGATAFDVKNTDYELCGCLKSGSTEDEVLIALQVGIPADAMGEKSATITFTSVASDVSC